jgi:hypothetical protein
VHLAHTIGTATRSLDAIHLTLGTVEISTFDRQVGEAAETVGVRAIPERATSQATGCMRARLCRRDLGDRRCLFPSIDQYRGVEPPEEPHFDVHHDREQLRHA